MVRVAAMEGNSSHFLSYFSAFLSDNDTERKKEEASLPTQKLLLGCSALTLTGYYIPLQMLSHGIHVWIFQHP